VPVDEELSKSLARLIDAELDQDAANQNDDDVDYARDPGRRQMERGDEGDLADPMK
jgi:hypothetical protein